MKLHGKIFFGLSLVLSFNAIAALPRWSYDPGPDPKTAMGKELIDITARIPDMPELSNQIMGGQKFRPAFGPVPWRMLQGKNKIKILFIGQDATHIAEAAGRPATAGFGGRAQDLAAYFGVNEGAGFINTYAFTIKGQYGAFSTPFAYDGREIRFGSFVDNGLWLLTHDLDSPILKWRNDLIDWIIRNNQDSLKLIVTFGGAARDAMGAFIESKGGKVGARYDNEMKRIQIAWTKLMYAGGNNEFPVVLNQDGEDYYSFAAGKKLDYTKTDVQEKAKSDLSADSVHAISELAFSQGGPHDNGLLHPAQLNGYDLDKIAIAGAKTRSLQGLPLRVGNVKNQLLVVELPHPTYLSNVGNTEASAAVKKNLQVLKPYVQSGWKIPADPSMVNSFAEGRDYAYSRADIGPEYYDFGTPGTRMVPVSTASRMGGNPHVIVFGTRDRAGFDMNAVTSLTNAKPASMPLAAEMFITRPRSTQVRYIFDKGPGEEYARLMKENLDMKAIFQVKAGKTFAKDGIDTYSVKNHPDIGDFGHYRGYFQSPKAIIIADPQGADDLLTARALTGTRGQYLQGLMEDLKVGGQYLVLKTVPFIMDGASDSDWTTTLERTKNYRKAVLSKLVAANKSAVIFADGKYAEKVAKELGLKVRVIPRTANNAADMKAVGGQGISKNIPRDHLSFYARTWEGTSGDRVLGSTDKYKGLAFAIVAPAWAWNQKNSLDVNSSAAVKKLLNKLKTNNLPLPTEDVSSFLNKKKSRIVRPGA